jgi:hypothetical protein
MAGAYSEYGIKRYMDETARLFDVLESRLSHADWLAGEKYTIADIASYSWVRAGPVFLDMDITKWPGIEKWIKRIGERPAVQKAEKIPEGTRSAEELSQMAKGESSALFWVNIHYSRYALYHGLLTDVIIGMRDRIDGMKETKRDS